MLPSPLLLGGKMKLIAQMVAKNEADRFLPEVLEHLRSIADVIVFTDDCSEDNTLEVAKSYGCETFSSSWEASHFNVNEGEQRSKAWHNLEQFATWGDWILAIDADEKLFTTTTPLQSLLNQENIDVLGISFFHMWDPINYRIDKAWKPSLSSRLFRYYPHGHFSDRKLACGSEPTYVQDLIRMGRAQWDSGLKMQHLGYVKDEDKRAKYDRYMQLDGGDFHSRTHIESIMDPSPKLALWTEN